MTLGVFGAAVLGSISSDLCVRFSPGLWWKDRRLTMLARKAQYAPIFDLDRRERFDGEVEKIELRELVSD